MNRPADWSGAWDWGVYPEDDAEMADFQLAAKAAEVLQEDFETPFFLSVGFFRPHVPLFAPPKWFDLYDVDSITLPNAPKSDLDDLAGNFTAINNYAVAPTHAEVVESGKQRSLTQAYLASISFVDYCVGVVMNALENGPHADNTIIVLWSDHGFHLGEKQHWAKRTLWEESTRVPLLFSGPGIAPGENCAEPASLLDIYPTLVELCELPKVPTSKESRWFLNSTIPQRPESNRRSLRRILGTTLSAPAIGDLSHTKTERQNCMIIERIRMSSTIWQMILHTKRRVRS